MDGWLNASGALPGATATDAGTLRAILDRGTRRIARVELSSGTVWVKRYGPKGRPFGSRMQDRLAGLVRQPVLRPSPRGNGEAMVAREIRRIEAFRRQGLPVPRILCRTRDALVLADVGETVSTRLQRLRLADPAAHDDLLVACAAALGALHGRGLCHGRPHPRDFFTAGESIGFMDFEEEPEAVMPLATAQARDLWLLFLPLVDRAAFGEATAARALAAWRVAAPAAAQVELERLLAFLGKFLWPARLIGGAHMGSDLRRFLTATRFLSQALSPPSRTRASKAGKDD